MQERFQEGTDSLFLIAAASLAVSVHLSGMDKTGRSVQGKGKIGRGLMDMWIGSKQVRRCIYIVCICILNIYIYLCMYIP